MVCLVLCLPSFLGYVVEIPVYLAAGWILYMVRLGKDVSVDWQNLGIGLGALLLLTLGVHGFCRWFSTAWHAAQPWRWRLSLSGVSILLLIALASIAALGITHQLVWLATTKERLRDSDGLRQAAARTQSTNNMKNIALGIHSYDEKHLHLPFGSTFDSQGRGLHGWQTLILPDFDQLALYEKIDLQQPWNAPVNVEFMKALIVAYQNPAIAQYKPDESALTHYAGNVHVLGPTRISLKDITDGAANTFLLGEVTHKFKPWGQPGNWRDPMLGMNKSPDGFGSPYKRGMVLMTMADASVHMIREDISPEVLKALTTPRGGETVDWSLAEY
jgi:hypothetical protein